MKVGNEIRELTIGAPAHGGACIARDESGRVVFVRHALPGERVRARIIDRQKRMAWADAIEILAAPIEFPACGPLLDLEA